MVDSTGPALDVGSQLRRVRQERGLSLAEAAAASNGRLKPSTLAAYERGERRVAVATLDVLARIYETPLTTLLPAMARAEDLDHDLLQRINHLPPTHRHLVSSLVDRMLLDVRASRGVAVLPLDSDHDRRPEVVT